MTAIKLKSNCARACTREEHENEHIPVSLVCCIFGLNSFEY